VNVQNIPRSDKVVKAGFVPKRDAFLFFDYKQIEYRLLAYYVANAARDESMAEVFRRGDDLHEASARALLGIGDGVALSDDERQVGKVFNFLTIYGGGAKKAATSLGVSEEDARRLQTVFHETWPGIRLLHNPPFRNGSYAKGTGPGAIQRQLERRGYITTLFGRHLHPESQHKALNALIQGCAADLIRHSMVRVTDDLIQGKFESRIVNVIHDELMFDAWNSEVPELVERVPVLMDYEGVSEVVPIEVDCEISTTNWADKEGWK
jgi:DNA polymerase I - 3''-5'' exonuclease and polymerase domains